jgi:hypothetical protein
MSEINGISRTTNNMTADCGMKGMHGNEPLNQKKITMEQNDIKQDISHAKHLKVANDEKGRKIDIKI